MSEPIEMTIKGEPPSKSNCYRVVIIKKHGSLAKTTALKHYEKIFQLQIPPEYSQLLIEKTVRVEIDCYYKSMRRDLDNAAKAILDCLQHGKVIKNDNKVIELMMRKFIDKENPRAEIKITVLGV